VLVLVDEWRLEAGGWRLEAVGDCFLEGGRNGKGE
jgi:hypothetical protein